MKTPKAESISKSGRRRILNKSKKSKNSDVDSNSSTSRKKQRVDASCEEKVIKNLTPDLNTSTTVVPAADEFKCLYCLSATNRQGVPEELLTCKDCNARVHPSCTDMTEELARRASSSPWQCIDCKTCNVCNDSGDAEEMLICDSCDKGYHMNCHKPPVPEKPTGKWVCCQCVAEQNEIVTLNQNSESGVTDTSKDGSVSNDAATAITSLPTPRESPVQSPLETVQKEATGIKTDRIHAPVRILPKLSETLVGEPPDATEWTPAEVAKFFYDMGFTEEAPAFENQEIDGRVLLLMTRMDVLTGLDFRLGPALKIYAHVQRLQTRDHWLAVNK